MVKYGQLKDLYLLKAHSQQWMCQIIERGSLLACFKAFDRCAHFDRIVRIIQRRFNINTYNKLNLYYNKVKKYK